MISWKDLVAAVPELAAINPWDENRARNSLALPLPPQDCRVVVAMSGGVDSTVVAGMLKAQGYDVVGITLQLYDHGRAVGKVGACCGTEDVIDARLAAAQFDIPYYVLDYKEQFHASVITPFADTYLAGATPVPCALCNQTVKFVSLVEQAKKLGAHALATGHYVHSQPESDGRWSLWRGLDHTRDQSWFLYQMTPSQLAFTRFPLGQLQKSVTRRIAQRLGLEVADKPDSQDICFVPNGRYADVLAKLRPQAARAGKIIHVDGTELGEHNGIHQFTVGQRRGLGIATGEPLFVVSIDAPCATVTVGPKSALLKKHITLAQVNWLAAPASPLSAIAATGSDTTNAREGENAGENWNQNGSEDAAKSFDETEVEIACRVAVRMRSSEELTDAVYYRAKRKGELRHWVSLNQPRTAISPGQSCVFYDAANRRQVLGGGTIAV